MTVFTIFLYTRNPEGLSGFHIDVIPARFTASLSLELHQTSTVEIHSPTSFRRTHVADPSWTVVRMTTLKLDIPEGFHSVECGTCQLGQSTSQTYSCPSDARKVGLSETLR